MEIKQYLLMGLFIVLEFVFSKTFLYIIIFFIGWYYLVKITESIAAKNIEKEELYRKINTFIDGFQGYRKSYDEFGSLFESPLYTISDCCARISQYLKDEKETYLSQEDYENEMNERFYYGLFLMDENDKEKELAKADGDNKAYIEYNNYLEEEFYDDRIKKLKKFKTS
jgi:hypothetical protein